MDRQKIVYSSKMYGPKQNKINIGTKIAQNTMRENEKYNQLPRIPGEPRHTT